MVKQVIIKHFGEEIIEEEIAGLMPILIIQKSKIVALCEFLKSDSFCYFDSLSCLTAIDNGSDAGTFGIVYNLYSIPYGHKLALKIILNRTEPLIPTVSKVWHSANWAEREAFDMYGIVFEGHPDLRRILLPEDWQGHPLKKDYIQQDIYHGIMVKY